MIHWPWNVLCFPSVCECYARISTLIRRTSLKGFPCGPDPVNWWLSEAQSCPRQLRAIETIFVTVRVLEYTKELHPLARQRCAFNPKTFLSTVGAGRTRLSFAKGQTVYAQGDVADALFVIQTGTVKVSAQSHGKEATLDILSDEDFVGEDSIAGQPFRTMSVSAITDCSLLRIEKKSMTLALTQQMKLADLFWTYVLARNIKYQQDLVDQRCNSSEKRLARILLMSAHLEEQGAPETTTVKLSHATLAEMVGTTRSRVCFFMKRFKESGFIYYEHKSKLLRVYRTLLAFSPQ
jgi:CRP/FNR family transcriptional regulator, cyclic AMP receptor protein